jgi:presenilin-like A22 family membrane protease
MSEQPADKKRVTPGNLAKALLVVLTIQFFSLLVTIQNLPVYGVIVNSTGYSYNPLGSSPAGATGNAFILVGLAFVLTLLLVRLLRRKMLFSFKFVVFGSVALSAFILTSLTADVFAFNYLPAEYENYFAFGVSLVVVVVIAYTVFVKNRPWLSTSILALVGAEVGSFFAETLSPYTALALPVAFSIYDIYAVFKGPLKQLVGTAPGIALVGMSIKAGEFTLGLGDIVFYTMLPALALFRVGTAAAIGTSLAIDAGVVVTLFLLSKRKLLPGLPIPMLLGVAAFLGYYL